MFEPDHESFADQPAPGQRLWRYMDLARYLSMLSTRVLHFARADQMLDRWEGAFGTANALALRTTFGDDYEVVASTRAQLRAHMRAVLYMSCWHLSEVESAAMWDLYQREGRGVAVVTDWAALTGSITSMRRVYGARVKYIDYDTTHIPEGNVFDAFLCKRESYAHEKEVRLITTGDTAGPVNPDGTHRGVLPEEPVLPLEVDLSAMITEVRVAPDASEWIHAVIQDVTRRYGFDFPVIQSDLARDPIA